jgi:hypothetical protein
MAMLRRVPWKFLFIAALFAGGTYYAYAFFPSQIAYWKVSELAQALVNRSHFSDFKEESELALFRETVRRETGVELQDGDVVFKNDPQRATLEVQFAIQVRLPGTRTTRLRRFLINVHSSD